MSTHKLRRSPTRRRAAAAIVLALAAGACGKATTPAQPAAATTTTAVLTKAAYARALLAVYHEHPGRDQSNYAAIAEGLNLIAPPPGYALRHKALIDEYLAVSQLSAGSSYQLGSDEGKADSGLMNLAYEVDPTAR